MALCSHNFSFGDVSWSRWNDTSIWEVLLMINDRSFCKWRFNSWSQSCPTDFKIFLPAVNLDNQETTFEESSRIWNVQPRKMHIYHPTLERYLDKYSKLSPNYVPLQDRCLLTVEADIKGRYMNGMKLQQTKIKMRNHL